MLFIKKPRLNSLKESNRGPKNPKLIKLFLFADKN